LWEGSDIVALLEGAESKKAASCHMSESFRLWWVEMEPHVLTLAVALIGLILALVVGRLLFKKGK